MIRQRRIRALTAVAVAALLLASPAAVPAVSDFPVCSVSGAQQPPDISGNRVVWEDERSGFDDIYAYDLGAAVESALTTAAGKQAAPRISGNRAVWEDRRNGITANIYAYDYGTGSSAAIRPTGLSNQIDPDIDGNTVVWSDDRNGVDGVYDIYAFDLGTAQESVVCTSAGAQLVPRVSGQWVVWQDQRVSSVPDIYAFDMQSQTESAVCTNTALQQDPAISYPWVVWSDYRNGDWDIYGYNLQTKLESAVCTAAGDQIQPSVDGDRVVWADQRDGDYDIYGRSFTSGLESQVSTATGDQLNPAVSGANVVWKDYRQDVAGDIFGNASAVVRVPVVNRIGGANRYEVAASMAATAYPGWVGVDDVIVTCGEDRANADPLSAAGLAGVYDAPILLTESWRLNPTTKNTLTRMAAANPGLQVHVVGGPGSVPAAVLSAMTAIPGVAPVVDRIGGADRYEVTANIANRMVDELGSAAIPGVLIVCGSNTNAFYDALAAGPLAANQHMPMLAVRPTSVPQSVRNVLNGALLGKPRYAVSATTYISTSVYNSVGAEDRFTNSTDRYVAASNIASEAVDARGWLSAKDTAIAAKLPDALTGGAFVGKKGSVLLFTDSTTVMKTAPKSWISGHKLQIFNGWVLGGPASVTEQVKSEFYALIQ